MNRTEISVSDTGKGQNYGHLFLVMRVKLQEVMFSSKAMHLSVLKSFSLAYKHSSFSKRLCSQFNILSNRLNDEFLAKNKEGVSHISKDHILDSLYCSENSSSQSMRNISAIKQVAKLYQSFLEVNELYNNDDSNSTDNTFSNECFEMLQDISTNFKQIRIDYIISLNYSSSDECFVEIRAGAGGLDSHDWAGRLALMLIGWVKVTNGYSATIIDTSELSDNLKDGIRHATLKITGTQVFGWLRSIAGTHRLVRVSPFDSQNKRHTSFAQLIIYPAMESNFVIDLRTEDIKVDTFRSSGPGGQHVNTTDSAIRITHIPTGIVVSSQNERSQHKNKASALLMLKSKLHHMHKEEQALNKRSSSAGDDEEGQNSWGTQIISVVMHPYQMVKDHRTGHSSSQIDAYLAGGSELTDLMEACLLQWERRERVKWYRAVLPKPADI